MTEILKAAKHEAETPVPSRFMLVLLKDEVAHLYVGNQKEPVNLAVD